MAVTVNDEVVAVSDVVLVADVSVAVVEVEVLPACHWKYACKASAEWLCLTLYQPPVQHANMWAQRKN